MAKFITSHPNIFFTYTIHSGGGAKNYIVRPPMSHPFEDMPPEDNDFYTRVGGVWSALSDGGVMNNNYYAQEVKARPVHPDAFDFDSIYTKSLAEVLRAVKGLDMKTHGVVVIDSISHMWEAAMEAYTGRMTSAQTIPMHAWGKIKKPYKDLMNTLMGMSAHVFILGRQKKGAF